MNVSRFAATVFALTLANTAMAADPVQQHNSNAVWFENWIGLTHGSLRVADPDGYITDVYTEEGTPVYELTGKDVLDGVYRYELRAATDELVKNRDYQEGSLNGNDKEYINKPFYTTGFFVVERGVIITPETTDEEKD